MLRSSGVRFNSRLACEGLISANSLSLVPGNYLTTTELRRGDTGVYVCLIGAMVGTTNQAHSMSLPWNALNTLSRGFAALDFLNSHSSPSCGSSRTITYSLSVVCDDCGKRNGDHLCPNLAVDMCQSSCSIREGPLSVVTSFMPRTRNQKLLAKIQDPSGRFGYRPEGPLKV